jgi:photosystem II stability/assembly factor-like uncharacterized protein
MMHFFTSPLSLLVALSFLLSPILQAIPQQQTACGIWSAEPANQQDQRLELSLVDYGTDASCAGSFWVKNNTGILSLGGYILEMESEASNAEIQWKNPYLDEDFLIPDLDMQLSSIPLSLDQPGELILSGVSTFDSYTMDAGLFFFRTGLTMAGVDEFVSPEMAAFIIIQSSDILGSTLTKALNGNFLGAYREFVQVQPFFWERVVSLTTEHVGSGLAAKLLKSVAKKPTAMAKIAIAWLTWMPKATFDALRYDGSPARVILRYAPPEPTAAPVPVRYGWVSWPSPTSNDLYDIEMVSPENIWAVGAGGTILHWNGYDWQQVPSPTPYDLVCVTMQPGTQGRAGLIGGDLATILLWDGSSWTAQSTGWGENHVFSACAANSYEYMVAAPRGGKMAVWNGQELTQLEESRTDWGNYAQPGMWLSNIKMRGDQDGWAVGEAGLLMRYDGSVWHVVESPVLNQPQSINSLEMVPGTDGNLVWFVGSNGAVMRLENGSFSGPWSISSEPLTEVSFVSAENGWTVGDHGLLAHWDGSNWSVEDSPTQAALYSLVMVDYADGWAVGAGGTILRYQRIP